MESAAKNWPGRKGRARTRALGGRFGLGGGCHGDAAKVSGGGAGEVLSCAGQAQARASRPQKAYETAPRNNAVLVIRCGGHRWPCLLPSTNFPPPFQIEE